MDYEKKYKEALEKARQINSEHKAQCFDVMVKVFPELAETEDEKIRKGLLYVIEHHPTLPTEEAEEYIAYLEKQGEWKPATHKYNVGATIYYNSFGEIKSMVVANVIDTGDENPMYEDADGNAVFEKDLILQMHAEKQKPVVLKFRVGDKVKKGYLTYIVESIDADSYKLQAYSKDGYKGQTVFLTIGCEDGYELVEQKPVEWSEKDEKRIEQICEDLQCGMENRNAHKIVRALHYDEIILSNISWLKSLRPRKQCSIDGQELQKNLDTIFKAIDKAKEELRKGNNGAALEALCIQYPGIPIQSHWRPSEKQLSALKEAFNKGSIDFHDMEILAGLYQTLIAFSV